MSGKRIMVFEQETTEYGRDVLVPLEVPEGIDSDNVREWLPTLYEHAHHHYTVMVVLEVREYQIKERPKVLYSECM